MATSPPRYNWSRMGMIIIAHLIRGTIAYNKRMGLSPDSFRAFDVSHTSVRNYAKAAIENPQQKDGGCAALGSIAPHLYYFTGLEENRVTFDPSRKYKDWQELAAHVGEIQTATYPDLGLLETLTARLAQGDPDFAATGGSIESLVERLVEARLEPLMRELQALRSLLVVAPRLTPMESFLRDWVGKLDDDQRESMGIQANAPWELCQERLAATLSAEGLITEDRARELVSGEGHPPSAQEKLLLSYKFQQPVTRLPYPLEFWDQFSSGPVPEPLGAAA